MIGTSNMGTPNMRTVIAVSLVASIATSTPAAAGEKEQLALFSAAAQQFIAVHRAVATSANLSIRAHVRCLNVLPYGI